jgi:hypothetical protein
MLALGSLGLVACAQLIGLDDTKDRIVAAPTDAGDAGDAGADSGEPPCDRNAECLDRYAQAPALCVEHHCVKVNTDLCLPQIYPKPDLLKNDDVLLIPAFIPRGAVLKEYPAALAYNLALKELTTGIPLEKRRDVAMLFCANDPALGRDAVTHVVNDLKLPVIAAGFGSDDLTIFVRDITRKAGVFVMNPNPAPEALKLDKEGRALFWSLLGSSADVALAYRPLVDKISAYVRKERSKTDVTIAVVHTKTPDETSAADVLHLGPYGDDQSTRNLALALDINGHPPSDDDKAHFQVFPFEGSEQKPKVELPSGLADNVATFKPDIIIALTAQEIGDLVAAVDAKMAAAGGPLPIWLLGQRNGRRADLLKYLANESGTLSETSEQRLKRFLGIQFAGSLEKAEHDAWLGRMDTEYKPPGTTLTVDYSAAENFYDAVYWITYGLYAGKLLNPTASDREAISAGVRHLLSGPEIRPAAIDQAFDQLGRKGDSLAATYVGALGHPDIDERFGIWRSVGATYCYPPAESNDAGAIAPRYDVQRYNPDGGTLVDVLDSQGQKKICFQY